MAFQNTFFPLWQFHSQKIAAASLTKKHSRRQVNLRLCKTGDWINFTGSAREGTVLAPYHANCTNAMRKHGNIEFFGSYEISKRFLVQIRKVNNLMVKRIGVDTHERRRAKAVRRGKRLPHFNRRLARLLHDLLMQKKKIKSSKNIYHELESV